MRRPFLLILFATSLWGASSALMARESVGLAGGGILAISGGVVLLIFSGVSGGWTKPRRIVKTVAPLGVLEAINLGFYALALKHGSVPIAVATHLSAPLILMGAAIAMRTRFVGTREISIFSLVVVGIVMIAITQPGADGSAIAGAGLGFASAVALAVLISQVADVAPTEQPQLAAAWQLLIAGFLLLPMALTGLPSGELILHSVGIGAALLGPAFYLYWKALQDLDAPTAAVLGLNEAIVAGLLAWLIGSGTPSVLDLIGALTILSAIALEITSPKQGSRSTGSDLPQKEMK